MAEMRFNNHGLLPPSDYELTLEELRTSLLVENPDPNHPDWNADWRRHLVGNLEILVGQLKQVGITEIFVDGSFVEEKDSPSDIDGYFICEKRFLASGRLHHELNMLDDYKIWTWDPKSRRPAPGSPKSQLPMWHQYRVELYPHYGQSSGIKDKQGNELEFPAAFRQCRSTYRPKGIVKIR